MKPAVVLVVLPAALLAGCFLNDQFRASAGADMTILPDDGDMTIDQSNGLDLAPASSMDLPTHVPTWTRHAMQPTSGNFYGPGLIWGSSVTDLYVVAADKTTNQASIWHSTDAIHWTEQWSAGSGSSPPTIAAMWGSSPHNVYAVGPRALLHSTGDGTWQDQAFLVPSGITASNYSAVWGSGINDVYVGPVQRTSDNTSGLLHIVTTASYQPIPGDVLQALWGSSATDVYASGAVFNSMLHTTGDGTWQKQSTLSPGLPAVSIWGSGPNDIYAAGNTPNGSTNSTNAIFHSTGNGTWTSQVQNTTSLATGPFIHIVYGTGPKDVYAAAPLMHTTGDGNWTNVAVVNGMNDAIGGIWAASSTNVFVTASAADGISSPILWIYQ